MRRLKAIGQRGSWFTNVEGEQIPCAWDWWRTGMHYHDPQIEPNTGKWVKYLAAIQSMKKVALTGKKETAEGKWERDGYIALYEVDNVQITETSLDFDLTNKLAELS